MDLVDEQDDVAGGLDLAEQALDALFKLAPELGPSHQGGQIQQIDLLVLQTGGHLAFGNALGQAFRDGGLAHTGFTDETGVIFLAAAEDLQRAVDFPVTADDAVGAAFPGFLGQVFAVGIQILAAGRLFLLAVLLVALAFLVFGRRAETEGERRAAPGHEFFVLPFLGGDHGTGLTGFLQEAGHPFLHAFQILIGHAEAFHQIIHRFDVHGLGTGQAVAFLNGFAVLHALYKYHCGTFFAAGTQHILSPLSGGRIGLTGRYKNHYPPARPLLQGRGRNVQILFIASTWFIHGRAQ